MSVDVIHTNPDILGGTPVFKGTRVPVEIHFHHLEKGISLDAFLDDFPTVSREQAVTVLALAEKLLTADNFKVIYDDIYRRKST